MERHGCSRHRHCSFVLLIVVVVVAYLLVGVVPALQASVIAEDDGRALMQFQSLITEDPYGALASWGGSSSSNHSASPATPCGWCGVTCGVRGRSRGRVTALDLRRLGLGGAIVAQSSLSSLTYLRWLDLSQNRLCGGVPTPLPLSLEYLNLSRNALQGAVSSELGSLRRLRILSLILLAEISVRNKHLVMQFNNLTGTLPPCAGNRLPRLKVLSVDRNQPHGAIPVSLCNSSKLEVIQMMKNSFSGVIPDCLGAHLQNLWELTLDDNQLEANSDSDWRFLDSLTNCSNLKVIGLAGNKLRGLLPASIANLSTSMEFLSIYNNMINGQIPQGIGNLVNLDSIYIHLNNLAGTIPDSIGKLKKLSNLYLYDNNLSGQIPATIGNLTMLSRLSLNENMLTGSIPSSLGNYPLETLELQNNRLTGPIPKEVLQISTLSTSANFQRNMLTGSLPSEVGDLKNLQTLDVSGNRLTGEIPASLGNCQILQYCIMKGNFLQGEIPSSIGQLRGLLVLDLSGNNLSGCIPDLLSNMKGIERLDISFNNFEGEVPKRGIFLNASAFSVEGITGLCGGIPELKLPPCSNYISTTNKRLHKLVMAISTAFAILGIALLLALFVFFRQTRNSRKGEHALLLISDQHVRVSYTELVTSTNGFASENLVGVGSFGSVYKGTMMSNEEEVVVAVKVLNLQQRGASQSFVAECETLRCARHRNLMKILTVCSSIDSRGLDFKAIVFDFLPNGNLHQWLHPREHGNQTGLSLIQRINIAIDVASALEYLHQYRPAPIVHCDLKPSNILLDNDMVAHVGDFGLARFVDHGQHSLPDISSGWATIRGTIGYAAPGQIGIRCSEDVPTDRLLICDTLRKLQGLDDKYRVHLRIGGR
uniref:non-specific serine/threonine protein kinase n=1 Tax=Oryza nivara TaxID=4536 RepID=A0A0E0JAM8_ORYNI